MSEAPSTRADERALRWFRWFVLGLLGLTAAYLVYRAVVLRIDYWDAYLYLNNARRMLGDATARYQLDKPPLVPMLYMPVVAATRDPASVGQLVGPHLMAVALAVGSMATVWWAFRRTLPATLALVGVLFFVGNRIFVHYAAFALTDVAATGLIAATFAAWFVARRQTSWRWFTVVGVLIGLSVAARYQAATLPFGIAAAELLIALRDRQIPDRRALGLVFASFLGFVIWILLHKWAFEAVDREWSFESLKGALEYAGAGAQRDHVREEPWQYFRMLPIAISPIVLALAAGGLLVGLWERRDADALFFAWLLFIGGGLFRVDHNEVRYLYTAFPALIYFALRPLELLPRLSKLRSALARSRPAAFGVGVAVVLVLVTLLPAFDQARRDQHPFFTSDIHRAAAGWLREHRGPRGALVWHGRPHSLHPPNPMQFEDDEYWNVFHLYAHMIEYYLGVRMEEWRWSGRTGDQILATQRERPIALLQGTVDDLHSWEIEVRDRSSAPIEVFASDVQRLQRDGDGWRAAGITLDRTPEGLVPDADLGRVELIIADAPVQSLGEMQIRRGVPIDLDLDADVESLLLRRTHSASFGVEGWTPPEEAVADGS